MQPPVPAVERGSGLAAGAGAYALWGVFPLVFHQLASVPALEVVAHRILWSCAFVGVLLGVRRLAGREVGGLPDRRQVLQLTGAALLVSTNWLVYVWAVAQDRVVEAALGYYINPLFTVAIGVFVLGEHLRRLQRVALGLGAVAVLVLTVAYGRPPWIALTLATTFSAYSYAKKSVALPAPTTLLVETATLVPFALAGLVVAQVRGEAAFLHGSVGRDVLLAALGVVTAVPLVLFAHAARRLPLSTLGLLQYGTPTLQLLCGVLVFGEDLPPARLAGFVLVWAALVVLATDATRAGRAGRAAAAEREPAPELV